MAFIGKLANEAKTNKKAQAVVSMHLGRIGLVLRGGLVKPGTLMDVLVGTDEDFGRVLVKVGTGSACKAFGKTGAVVSWAAARAASKVYASISRAACTVLSNDANGILIQIDYLKKEEA